MDFDPKAFVESQGQTPPPEATPDDSQEAPAFDPKSFVESQQPQDSSQSFDPQSFVEGKNHEKYGTGSQEAITALEGVGQGLIGPVAPWVETHLMGVDPADIEGRENENPGIKKGSQAATIAGSLMIGWGEAALISKALPEMSALAELGTAGKVGSMALKGALESASLQGSDELAKKVYQQPNPSDTASQALSNIGYAGILGGGVGGAFGLGSLTASKGLKAIEDSKLIERAEHWLAGYGASANGRNVEELTGMLRDAGVSPTLIKTVEHGAQAHAGFTNAAVNSATDGASKLIREKTLGPIGLLYNPKLFQKFVEPIIKGVLKKPVSFASNKFILPFVTKALTSGNAKALPAAIEMAMKAAKGSKQMETGLNSLFSGESQQALDFGINEGRRQKIQDSVDNNELENNMQAPQDEAQGFAEGGVVQESGQPFSETFPDENMLFHSAKARVHNHLKSLKPQQAMGRMAFDSKEPSIESKRDYNKALDYATNPMIIFKHLKQGTMTARDAFHMNQMWPEIADNMRRGITQKVTNQQLKGEKPPFAVRQSLSLFMGVPLESMFLPQSIMAAQATFAPQQQPGQQEGKTKKGTTKLGSKTNKLYTTPVDAAAEEQQARK